MFLLFISKPRFKIFLKSFSQTFYVLVRVKVFVNFSKRKLK